MGAYSSRVNPAIVSRQEPQAFIPIYAQAATEGASQARQVADRWHLLKNLREAVERVLERHAAIVDAALKTTETPAEPATGRWDPSPWFLGLHRPERDCTRPVSQG
jgi:hypothetical protein